MTNRIPLGKTGPLVSPLALGCMGMSNAYGPADEAESLATIHEALERGINLIDTGDFYGAGHNELLIGRAIKGRRDQAVLSVKFGAMRDPAGGWGGFDARPSAVKNFVTYSLVRLGVEHIDVYRPARLDPQVPIEDTVGAVADLVKAGYVKHIGLSEVGTDTIKRAAAVHPIVDLQIEYSIITRGPEAKIFPLLAELGIACTAYGVLSRGLLTSSPIAGKGDFRAFSPRFQGENRAANQKLVDALAQLAKAKGVTPAQLAIAYARAKYPFVIPTVGARKRTQLTESLGALAITLSPGEINALETAIPHEQVAGTRYAAHAMASLDSEK